MMAWEKSLINKIQYHKFMTKTKKCKNYQIF